MCTRTAFAASLLVVGAILHGASAQEKVGNVFVVEANSTAEFIALVQGYPSWNRPVVRENLQVVIDSINVTLDEFQEAVPRSWDSILHGDLILGSSGQKRVWIDAVMRTGKDFRCARSGAQQRDFDPSQYST